MIEIIKASRRIERIISEVGYMNFFLRHNFKTTQIDHRNIWIIRDSLKDDN